MTFNSQKTVYFFSPSAFTVSGSGRGGLSFLLDRHAEIAVIVPHRPADAVGLQSRAHIVNPALREAGSFTRR